MASTKYQYYLLENKHIKDVQSIFWKVFRFKISENDLKSKYNTSYLGLKSISTIAYDKQKPIAFYGAIPQQFGNKNTTFLVAHTCDSYTLPNYQKQGLHRDLAFKSYEKMQQQYFKMAYAFHSENTYYSTKKLNWKKHHQMARFHIKVNQIPIGKVLNKIGLLNTVITKSRRVFKPYLISEWQNPFGKTKLFHNQYNSEFYTYKNGFNQHFLIELNNCVFYIKINSTVNVGFFDFDKEDNLKNALNQLKQLVTKIGLNEILFQIDECSYQKQMLEKIETPLPSWLIGYIPFEKGLTLNNFGFNFADLDTF